MASISVTEADLLEALATASTAPEDARSAQQMADESGLNVRQVRRALHALQAQGRLQIHRVPQVFLDGRRGLVSAYTISQKAPAKKSRRR